jgi:hypothetical protein
MRVPRYVKEFRRWREAPVSERWLVLRDQAARRIDPGPDFDDCWHNYELILQNGKRVHEIHPDHLQEIRFEIYAWHRAIRIAIRASSDG